MARLMKTTWIMALGLVLVLVTSAQADPLRTALQEWEPAGILGPVMSSDGDEFVVEEQRIVMVNSIVGTTECSTMVRTLAGQVLDRSAVRTGETVLVKGAAVYDERLQSVVIVAREVILVPAGTSPEELARDPLLKAPAEPW